MKPTTTLLQALSLRDTVFNVRNLIGTRAVVSSVLNQINSEIIGENLILSELSNNTHHYLEDTMYFILFSFSLYLEYKYFTNLEKKWSGVAEYNSIQDKTKTILFIIISVFTRNVEHAS